jgi:hypothetical protein
MLNAQDGPRLTVQLERGAARAWVIDKAPN